MTSGRFGIWSLALMCALANAANGAPSAQFVLESEAVFSRPHDLVLGPGGHLLFVSDLGGNRVAVLDPRTLALVGSIGEGELDAPHDLVFDPSGRLLVADSGNDRIAVFEVEGASGRLSGVAVDGLASPEGVDSDGEHIYVTNVGRGNVEIYAAVNGQRLFAAGGLSRPHDIELGPDGMIYVADPGHHRIVVFDKTLAQHREYARTRYDFNEPKYLALDDKGLLYVADQYNNLVKVIARVDGMIKELVEEAAPGSSLNRIEGVEVVGSELWIADTYNNRILYYRINPSPHEC